MVISIADVFMQNIFNLSDYLNKQPQDLTACVMDRPRHDQIINDLKELKVNNLV